MSWVSNTSTLQISGAITITNPDDFAPDDATNGMNDLETTRCSITATGLEIVADSGSTSLAKFTATTARIGAIATEHVNVTASTIDMKSGGTQYASFGSTCTIGIATAEHVNISSSGIVLKDNLTDAINIGTDITISGGGNCVVNSGHIKAGAGDLVTLSGTDAIPALTAYNVKGLGVNVDSPVVGDWYGLMVSREMGLFGGNHVRVGTGGEEAGQENYGIYGDFGHSGTAGSFSFGTAGFEYFTFAGTGVDVTMNPTDGVRIELPESGAPPTWIAHLEVGNYENLSLSTVNDNVINDARQYTGSEGYTWLPGGILMQWGYIDTAVTNGQLVFAEVDGNISFPNNCFNVQVSMKNNYNSYSWPVHIKWSTKDWFNYYTQNPSTKDIFYLAIGN
jgi:hypothetical protein